MEFAFYQLIKSRHNSDFNVIRADNQDLPTYLIGIIGYLHGVAADQAWQNLVSKFVTFEKVGCQVNDVYSICFLLSTC